MDNVKDVENVKDVANVEWGRGVSRAWWTARTSRYPISVSATSAALCVLCG